MLSMNGRVENKSNSNLLCFRFMHSKKFQAGSEFNQNTYDGKKMNEKCSLGIIQLTTSITETSITNPTRITNEMATSSDYLLKYFNGFLAVLLE